MPYKWISKKERKEKKSWIANGSEYAGIQKINEVRLTAVPDK